MPFSLSMILFSIGIYKLHTKDYKRAKQLLLGSFIWLSIWSYSPLVNSLLYKLETSYPSLHKVPKGIHYIYLLGGGHHTDNSLPITSQIEPTSVVRLTEAMRLYHQLPNAKIILSGYNGFKDKNSHALMQYKLATALGIPSNSLILKPLPKDTKEEAITAKKIISQDPFILVTSASHMKRAMILFKQQGLHPIPAPTNHLANTSVNLWRIFSIYALYKSNILWHEYLGILWQKIVYIF